MGRATATRKPLRKQCKRCNAPLTRCHCRRQNGKDGHGPRGVQGHLTGSTQPPHPHRKAAR